MVYDKRVLIHDFLLISDTDSLFIEFRSKNIDEDLARLADTMDFSNFAPTHPLYNIERMSQLFCMKIEGGNHRIVGFCALKAKCYCLLVVPNDEQLKYERENG